MSPQNGAGKYWKQEKAPCRALRFQMLRFKEEESQSSSLSMLIEYCSISLSKALTVTL